MLTLLLLLLLLSGTRLSFDSCTQLFYTLMMTSALLLIIVSSLCASLVLEIYQHSQACYSSRCSFLLHSITTNCSRACSVVGVGSDARLLSETTIVVWDAIWGSATALSYKRSHQRYVGFFWESPANYRVLQNAAAMRVFDYEYSYRPTAQMYNMGSMTGTTGDLEYIRRWRVIPFAEKQRNVMMTAWISNCHLSPNQRLTYLTQLSAYNITARNFGQCRFVGESQRMQKHNMSWEETATHYFNAKHGRLPVREDVRIRENLYEGGASLFYYAAENSNCEYYHTEKVWLALLSGAVPVYLGWTPTARESFPHNAVIYVDDYRNTKELADYLLELANNESAYNRYLEWRTQPFTKIMTRNIHNGLAHKSAEAFCDLCTYLHETFNTSGLGFVPQDPKKCK